MSEVARLDARVDQLISARRRPDGNSAVVVKIDIGTNEIFKPEITIPNQRGLLLDQKLVVIVETVSDAE